MEGFGSADYSCNVPLTYGSVHDGITTNPGFEHKLRKTYWKTKQTVIKKLKKSEDSFVVAGDTDIDAKLEVNIMEIYSIIMCTCTCIYTVYVFLVHNIQFIHIHVHLNCTCIYRCTL